MEIHFSPAKNVYTIDANRGTLSLYKVKKNACMIAGSYHYSTGMNGSTDYTAGGTGPLPPGKLLAASLRNQPSWTI